MVRSPTFINLLELYFIMEDKERYHKRVKSHFMFADFLIKYYLDRIKESETSHNLDELAKNMILVDQFLLRRIKDIGFHQAIFNEINSDYNLYSETLKLIGEYFQTPKVIKESISSGGFYVKVVAPQLILESDDNKQLNLPDILTASHDSSPIEEYLKYRLKLVRDKNDFEQIRALDAVLKSQITGGYQGFQALVNQYSPTQSLYLEPSRLNALRFG